MYRIVMMMLLVALPLVAGCNKPESKGGKAVEATGADRTAGSQVADDSGSAADIELVAGSPDGDGTVTLEQWEGQMAEKLPPLDAEQLEMIRGKLVGFAPDQGFEFDAETNLITGPGLSAEGLDMAVLVDKVSWAIRREQRELQEIEIDKMCMMIFEELKPQEQAERRPPSQPKQDQRQERVRPGGSSDNGGSGSSQDERDTGENSDLVFASSAIGLWKSIREDLPRMTTYHNDDYFDYLELWYDGAAYYKIFRKQQMTYYKEYTYSYQSRTGSLSLIDEDGKVEMEMILRMKKGDEELLFVDQPNSTSTTVFEKIGTGQPPPPDPSGIGPGTSGKLH